MRGVNKVFLIGNVGASPEIKTFDNGGSVANLSLATSEIWKDKNGEVQTATEWHRLSAFGKLVDVIEKYVKKGDKIYVEGKNKTRSWEDKDGIKRYTTEIVIRELTMLGSKDDSTGSTKKSETKTDGPVDAPQPESDDLPF